MIDLLRIRIRYDMRCGIFIDIILLQMKAYVIGGVDCGCG